MPYKDKEKQREAQRKWEKENRGAGKRHKVWMFIFYPDTAEVGWRDECDELGLPFLVSPLHDRDVWTAADERRNPDHIEGEVKVAHHPCEGAFCDPLAGGVPTPDPDPMGSLRGLAPSCERRREPAKHHTGVVCEHPSVKAPKAAREQDGSVYTKSRLRDFVYTLPKSCNSKSGLGR